MHVEHQPGYVLHARPYRETSLLLEIFTQDYGRVGLVARGVRCERTRLPRALLQPLQPLLISWKGRGELAALIAAEATANPFYLQGVALLCTLYINELMLRLTARNDTNAEAYSAYKLCLERLTTTDSPAWTLRRFERDLLWCLGYGLVLDHEPETGLAITADLEYGYHAEHGARPWRPHDDGVRVFGVDLLNLAADQCPDAAGLARLKRTLRSVISLHLGDPKGLRTWSLWRGMSVNMHDGE